MASSDILIRENRVSVVGRDTEQEDGLERGALEVSVGPDKTPSIRLSADQANVNIGGGQGTSTEGDLRLNDAEGNTRIQITAADDGNRPPGGTERVWINAGAGEIELSTSGQGSNRGVRISAAESENIESELDIGGPVVDSEYDLERGSVNLAAIKDETDPDVSGSAGLINLTDYGQMEPSVSVRGDEAMLALGYSVTERTFGADAPDIEGPYGVGGATGGGGTVDYETVAGENGKIYFDDGTGAGIRIIAENGKLKIGGDSDFDGSFDTEYLVVDPQNKEIRTPWNISAKNVGSGSD